MQSQPENSTHVHVVPPDPAWANAFAGVQARIVRACPGLGVHHIGSTSIKGIWAKPIIDLLLVAASLQALETATPELQRLGFQAMGEFGISGRRYFRQHDAQGIRRVHAHGFAIGSREITRHMAFRDYMNAHPEAALAYSALKQHLASAHAKNMNAYMDGKDALIKHHEALAMAWHAERLAQA